MKLQPKHRAVEIMNMNGVLKITGILIASLVAMLVAAYFAYPYLNEEKYQELVEEYQIPETDPAFEENEIVTGARDGEASVEEMKKLRKMVDSLETLNEQLKREFRDSLKVLQESMFDEDMNASVEVEPASSKMPPNPESLAAEAHLNQEAFKERVKSLLNLDEESLSPILNQMTNEQLVRLYGGAGNIQREKLLRSLDPERAAKLMTEVML